MRSTLKKHLDFLEDEECLRIQNHKKQKKEIEKELMKLVPFNHKIDMLPAFFNHTDGERIGTVIRDTCQEFIIQTDKRVLFSVAVKIFPYGSEINSVRIVLARFYKLPENATNQNPEKDKKSKRGKSRGSSKSGKSKSGRGSSRQSTKADTNNKSNDKKSKNSNP